MIHPSEHDTPYEGNEDAWTAKPRAPSPTPEAIRRHADRLLAEGRLHRDAWADIDHLLLNGEVQEAAVSLELQASKEPVYPVTPGPRGED